ncbi:L,D-transpeptidase family protein [Pedobacter panaciterrae]|uniref:L,D-transpeptidase family protein n=1 Tax=Pedobacter panaciterrae TaxID=363849 RepID=UPI002593AF67|nr:L,D-transpeptidase family protein [uncultured Pedobacter sp.]
MKKTVLPVVVLITMLSSCNWFKDVPEVGVVLSGHFKNKLYKKFDTAVYNVVFKKHLDSLKPKFSNPNTLTNYYYANEYKPELVTKFFVNGGLDSLENYIGRSEEHGFSPNLFRYKQIESLLATLHANKFKSIDEVYPVIADLELNAAEGLIKYNNFVYYGSINPRKLFSRYYVPVKRPDSLSVTAVLETKDIQKLLTSIQPSSPDYQVFQHKLSKYKADSGSKSYMVKTIMVNMERLRWKLPELGDEYVQVNIPDFSLTWFKNQDTLTQMKVCVGGKREEGYADKIKQYLKSGNLDDKPKNHETPLLYSKLNSIQVNPIWNIPVSIAQSEIYWQAVRDPYYLSNSNIKVYYKGKQIGEPDTIQWSKYSREKLPFQFKQGSGEGNALGKFKFIFDNGSSIYLHDTNNKSAFSRANRAISHGCVRVEKPLQFAETLVKDKYEYDQLRMEVNLPPIDTNRMAVYRKKMAKKADTVNVYRLKPKWFGVKKPVPLIINYITAWSQNGSLQFRPDVYGLDETLWDAMKKFM